MKSLRKFSILATALFALSCSNKLIPNEKNQQYGYTNPSGKWVIDPKYAEAYPFKEGFAKVGFLSLRTDSIWNEPMFGNEGYWDVDVYEVTRYSFIDKNDSLFPLVLKDAKAFSQGLAAAKHKNEWGYINTRGEWQIPPRYFEAGNFVKGKAQVTRLSQDGQRWHHLTINQQGEIIEDDPEGSRKPNWLDSIPDWHTLMASADVYVRLNDYESAFAYYEAAGRRKNEIEAEDTLAYVSLCQELAYFGAMRIEENTFETFDALAQAKIEEVLNSEKNERRRMILLEHIDYLYRLSELREVNLEQEKQVAALERLLDVVKRSETEDMSLYWDIEEKLEELTKP